jgi:hypothetical protein
MSSLHPIDVQPAAALVSDGPAATPEEVRHAEWVPLSRQEEQRKISELHLAPRAQVKVTWRMKATTEDSPGPWSQDVVTVQDETFRDGIRHYVTHLVVKSDDDEEILCESSIPVPRETMEVADYERIRRPGTSVHEALMARGPKRPRAEEEGATEDRNEHHPPRRVEVGQLGADRAPLPPIQQAAESRNGQPPSADAQLVKLVQIVRELEGIHGADHENVALPLNLLGTKYLHLGDYGRARDALERALPILEASYGADHVLVASTLEILGCAYVLLGEYGRARDVCERTVRILKARCGDDTESLNHLADAYAALARAARSVTTDE